MQRGATPSAQRAPSPSTSSSISQPKSPSQPSTIDAAHHIVEPPSKRRRHDVHPTPSGDKASPQHDEEEGGSGDGNCVICLERITEICTTVPCGHRYDLICILSWLEVRACCPLCKTVVGEVHSLGEDGQVQKHIVEAPKSVDTASTEHSSAQSTDTRGINQLYLRDRISNRHRRRRRRTPSPIPADTAILRRRFVYKHNLRSLYVGSNRMSRFRNVGPKDFREDEELCSRARMWLRREFEVWEWTSAEGGGGVAGKEFLVEWVVGVLKSVDLKGGEGEGQAAELVREVVGLSEAHAGVFVHELYAFLKSPFTTLRPFDEFVQYSTKIPRHLLPENLDDIVSSSSSSTPIPASSSSTQPPPKIADSNSSSPSGSGNNERREMDADIDTSSSTRRRRLSNGTEYARGWRNDHGDRGWRKRSRE